MSDPGNTNRQELLDEAIEILHHVDLTLGQDVPTKNVDSLKDQAIELLEDLKTERVSFAPKLGVYRLAQEALKIKEEELSFDLRSKMKNHDFFKIDIPVTLTSTKGWAFTNLFCKVVFCPEEKDLKDAHQLPTIHDLFPADEWQDILSVQDHLTLGLDENFAFRADVEKAEGQWKKLSGDVQAKLILQAGGGAKLAVGPFMYHIRKAKIKSRGRGNVESSWELNGTEHVNEQDIQLGVVLMVPKSRKKPINVIGALEASHNFQFLSADIFENIRQYFNNTLKAFFDNGAPIKASQAWKDIIHPAR